MYNLSKYISKARCYAVFCYFMHSCLSAYEIRIVYARTSLLSNSKVTEQQKTSAEKSSTPQQAAPAPTETVEGWGNCITPGCEGPIGCIMFN